MNSVRPWVVSRSCIMVVIDPRGGAVPAVRTGPIVGLAGQVAVLAALAFAVGLGRWGWLVGLAYGVLTWAILGYGLHRTGRDGLGPADRVTLGRGLLVGGVAALTADSFTRMVAGPLVVLTVVALALDAIDGLVARRTGTVSEFGARFDMEIDAFLILLLSVETARLVGGWVLAIGAMRYLFVAAGWPLPWMRAPLPPRYWRKVAAATQGVALVVATADVFPRAAVTVVLVAALAQLGESFGRDVRWLWHQRGAGPVPTGPVARLPARH